MIFLDTEPFRSLSTRKKTQMTLQEFLVTATRKAMTDLEKALDSLPEDKRNFSPGGKARTAADMAAECAILNGVTAQVVVERKMDANFDYAEFTKTKDTLARKPEVLHTLLNSSTEKFIAAITSVPVEDLEVELDLPWGKMTIAQVLAYPYWNMSYHEGQIYYIGSMLG